MTDLSMAWGPLVHSEPDITPTTVVADPTQRRDLILIERARAGDLEAFNDLVRAHQDQLFALVVRMVPDRDQASDVVQEAFFSAYKHLDGFRGGMVKSWLNRIAVNAAMDIQRARKRRPVQPYPEYEDESWQPPAGDEADPERTAVLQRADTCAVRGVRPDHERSARRHRAVRRGRLRLRGDRRDDRGLAGHGQVPDPSGPAGASRPVGRSTGTVPWVTRAAADGADGPARHDDHDPELIASLLDRDLSDTDRAAAEARIAACTSCAALEIDLRILAKATIALPAPMRARDFSLTPAVAAALSRGTARNQPSSAPVSRARCEIPDRPTRPTIVC